MTRRDHADVSNQVKIRVVISVNVWFPCHTSNFQTLLKSCSCGFSFWLTSVCKLCNKEGCPGNESCSWRRRTLFWGSGLSLPQMLFPFFFFGKIKWFIKKRIIILFWGKLSAVSGVRWEIWEEICDAGGVWHSQHLRVTYLAWTLLRIFRCDTPCTCQNAGPVLQSGS